MSNNDSSGEWIAWASRRMDEQAEAIVSFRAERDRLAAQVSAMREAMGEEFDEDSDCCPECGLEDHEAHFGNCTRGRFFAALAAQEGQ